MFRRRRVERCDFEYLTRHDVAFLQLTLHHCGVGIIGRKPLDKPSYRAPDQNVGETLTIIPQDQDKNGPGATKLVVTKISKGKAAYDGSKTVRVSMTATTGNDQGTNEDASMPFCGVMSSIDPDSGEQLSGRGGMMISANPPTTLGKNKT